MGKLLESAAEGAARCCRTVNKTAGNDKGQSLREGEQSTTHATRRQSKAFLGKLLLLLLLLRLRAHAGGVVGEATHETGERVSVVA